jgi:hypothetical protein
MRDKAFEPLEYATPASQSKVKVGTHRAAPFIVFAIFAIATIVCRVLETGSDPEMGHALFIPAVLGAAVLPIVWAIQAR